MAFDVAGHPVDEVGHGNAGIGSVRGFVDDGGFVDRAIGAQRVEAFVPVDVTG